jgi:hypothetical protein
VSSCVSILCCTLEIKNSVYKLVQSRQNFVVFFYFIPVKHILNLIVLFFKHLIILIFVLMF